MYLKAIAEGISRIPKIPIAIKNRVNKEIEELGEEEIYKKLCDLDPLSKLINAGDSQRVSRAYEVFKHTEKSLFEWNKMPNKKFFNDDEVEFDIQFVERGRQEIYERINVRFENMVENGVLNEAEKANETFKSSGLSQADLNRLPAYKAHGLREMIGYLNGDISKDVAIEKAQQATRNYAKRQFTWWRNWKNLTKNL